MHGYMLNLLVYALPRPLHLSLLPEAPYSYLYVVGLDLSFHTNSGMKIEEKNENSRQEALYPIFCLLKLGAG